MTSRSTHSRADHSDLPIPASIPPFRHCTRGIKRSNLRLSQVNAAIPAKELNLNSLKIILMGLAFLSAALPGTGAQENKDNTGTPMQGVHEIQMTLRKYEFTPGSLLVKKGERVRLIMAAVDHNHGFKLDDFDINQKVRKGTTAIVEFTADRSGTFQFRCSNVCGLGHRGMKGTLVVQE
jgi:cytochrome c oxidase subunit II